MHIRLATSADGPAIVGLVRALAEYEKLPPPDQAAEERLLRDAFATTPPRVQFWVAADERGEIVAYAACFETYSTFRARPSLYLEDLFVHPAARRRGLATSMLAHLREEAERRQCGRFEWTVLEWNQDAMALYQGIGAEILHDWRLVRLDLRYPESRRS